MSFAELPWLRDTARPQLRRDGPVRPGIHRTLYEHIQVRNYYLIREGLKKIKKYSMGGGGLNPPSVKILNLTQKIYKLFSMV